MITDGVSRRTAWSIVPEGGISPALPKVLRIANTSGNYSAFWKASKDIRSLPLQTIEVKHRGLKRDDKNYGRVIVGSAGGTVEYQTYHTTGHLNHAYGAEPLPTNKFPWEFGAGNAKSWYVTQVQFDYSTYKVRARLGKVVGANRNIWNNWTPWMEMASIDQPKFAKFGFNGVIEIDDVSLTAIPK